MQSVIMREEPECPMQRCSKTFRHIRVSIDYLLGNSNTPTPADKIADSLPDDIELFELWNELKRREELQLLLSKQKTCLLMT